MPSAPCNVSHRDPTSSNTMSACVSAARQTFRPRLARLQTPMVEEDRPARQRAFEFPRQCGGNGERILCAVVANKQPGAHKHARIVAQPTINQCR